MTSTSFGKRIALKNIAVPHEHGVWGLLLEPVLIGLVLFPSFAGLSLSLAALVAVFAQHPLSLYLTDKRRGVTYPRTAVALKLFWLYSLIVALWLGLALLSSPLSAFFPLLLALPFGIFQLHAKTQLKGRALLAELAGAVAIAALGASLVLAGQGSIQFAFGLLVLLVLRSLPSILYIRTRLRLERGEMVSRWPALAASILAVIAINFLVRLGFVPMIVNQVFLVLFIRAAFGLSFMRFHLKARGLGMIEMLFGLLLVSSVIIGYYLHL